METKILDQNNIEIVGQLLRNGEIVAFPTETVYGLAANAIDEAAVTKVFAAKDRPQDNPLNVLVETKDMMKQLTMDIPDYVDVLVDTFSPGPITYVLKNAGKVAPNVSGDLTTIGVRIPDHPIALSILKYTGLPLAAPSANKSGRPSPTTAQHVIHDLSGEIAAIVDGGKTNVGLESTVIDCTGEIPMILRTGLITKEDITEVVGACDMAPSLEMPSNKYKHYTPEVPLILVQSKAQLIELVEEEKRKNKRVGVIVPEAVQDMHVQKMYILGKEETENARNLYDVLRAIQKTEVDVVISAPFKSKIVMNRLEQAASKVVHKAD